MGLIQKIQERWINFVNRSFNDKRGVVHNQCEWSTLHFPTTAVSEDEKYDFISQAAGIMEDEIKIVNPKLKSKNKSK
jgi:hypothetical protein